MGDGRRVDDPGRVEVDALCVEIVEQTDATAEEDGRKMDLHLIEEVGGEALLRDVRPAAARDVLATGRVRACSSADSMAGPSRRPPAR